MANFTTGHFFHQKVPPCLVSVITRSTITRSPSQKPAHKDLDPKWPGPCHLGSSPLMLRLLNAPARAQL
ncbi:hypothetical protein FBD73_06465 [Lacticaseibacillus paracasei]|nr:hypothetical protein EVE90_04400 [Lacticaseibacillus paracasei]QKK92710.1 hypothetical protein FBD73_06465 [Lacticaseibacillus paracasei]RUS39291.1 hypothetical protein IJ11_0007465 [Lacticaseibacillus paracasei]